MAVSRRVGSTLSVAAFVGLALLVGPEALAQDAGPESPWTVGLVLSMSALAAGACAAILGLWIGRDKRRPILFALAMTVLIFTAVCVGIFQSYLDAVDGVNKRADLERMMGMVTEIAINTGDPELAALVEQQTGEKIELPEPVEEPAEAVEDTGEANAETEGEEGEEAEGEDAEGEEGEEGEEATAEAAEPTEGGADAPAQE